MSLSNTFILVFSLTPIVNHFAQLLLKTGFFFYNPHHNSLLHDAVQRASAIHGVVARIAQPLFHIGGQLDADVLSAEPLLDLLSKGGGRKGFKIIISLTMIEGNL